MDLEQEIWGREHEGAVCEDKKPEVEYFKSLCRSKLFLEPSLHSYYSVVVKSPDVFLQGSTSIMRKSHFPHIQITIYCCWEIMNFLSASTSIVIVNAVWNVIA